MDELLLTSSSLIDILSQLAELADKDISVYEDSSGIHLEIDDNRYLISDRTAYEIEVPQAVVRDVQEVVETAQEDLEYSGMTNEVISEDVCCGILGQVVKTLLVGGLVRLTNKLLRK